MIHIYCENNTIINFPSKLNEYRFTFLLNLIHLDINGHFHPSHTQFKYFITFIDDFSKYTITYLLKVRAKALQKFQKFKTYSNFLLESLFKFYVVMEGGIHLN